MIALQDVGQQASFNQYQSTCRWRAWGRIKPGSLV